MIIQPGSKIQVGLNDTVFFHWEPKGNLIYIPDCENQLRLVGRIISINPFSRTAVILVLRIEPHFIH
ncbi:MAG: hypothetical protein Kow0042_31010 [Calditrichia bacterium]